MRNTAPCTPSRPVNYLSGMMDGRPLRNAAHLPPIAADRRLQPTGRAMLLSCRAGRRSGPPSNAVLSNLYMKTLMRFLPAGEIKVRSWRKYLECMYACLYLVISTRYIIPGNFPQQYFINRNFPPNNYFHKKCYGESANIKLNWNNLL